MRSLFVWCASAAALAFAAGPARAIAPLPLPPVHAPAVRRIIISGNNHTRDRAILRELDLHPGEPLREGAERSSEARLLDLGLFSDVEVRADPVSPDSVDVSVHVRERMTFLPIPVFDYSAEDGATYGLTIRESNFLGDAQRIGASALFGGRRSVSLAWELPWFGRFHMGFFASGYDSRWEDKIEHLNEHRQGARWGASRFFDGYRYSIGIDGRGEDVRSSPIKGADSTVVRVHDLERSLALSVGYDTRDFRTNPHRGLALGVRFEQLGSWLGGDVTMSRTSLAASLFVPASRSVTLALGVQGILTGGEVPNFERLRLGGIDTVRGFAEGYSTGDSRGWGSVELRFPIFRKRTFVLPIVENFDLEADGAIFGDVGAIWAGRDYGSADLLSGAGIGLRLFMPLAGTTRSDVAYGSAGDVQLRGSGGMKF